jgi:glycerol-3-phosphate cytidylyltransferase
MISVGITFGSWDLLHPGHVILLNTCKDQCDKLYIGLHTDPSTQRLSKNRPIQTSYERYIQLCGILRSNDEIVPYDTELDVVNMLSILPVTKRFIGSEYYGTKLTGHDICTTRSIEIIYISRLHNYSSSELRNRIAPCKGSR